MQVYTKNAQIRAHSVQYTNKGDPAREEKVDKYTQIRAMQEKDRKCPD